METKTKESKESEKEYYQTTNESFFTKKKIIFILVWIIVFIILIALTLKFVLNIEFNDIIDSISKSHNNNKYFWLWLTLLLLFPIYNCFLRIFTFYYKLHQKKIFVRWYEWLNFCFFTFFISGITPFSMGAEPYIIYWLKKRGLSYKESTAIVLSFSIINPFVQIIVTWPSFFYLCSDYGFNSNNLAWTVCFWLVFLGLMIDLISSTTWLILGYSKNAHYIINLFINKIKKILKLKHKTKEQIRIEYKENQEFKKIFISELRDVKFMIILSMFSFVWNIFYYSTLIFAFNLLDPNFSFNYFQLFNYVNVSTTANNFIPIPGAEGTLQTIIVTFIRSSKNAQEIPKLQELSEESVFVWRATTFYITTILGVFSFVFILIKYVKYSIIRKRKIKNNIELNKGFTFIIKNANDVDSLITTLKSIRWCDYNQKFVDIVVVVDSIDFLEARIDEIAWYDVLKIVIKQYDSDSAMLKNLLKRSKLNREYVSIINSGEKITYETLKNINIELNKNDIYMGSYRRIKGKKVSSKKSPYPYFFQHVIKNKEQMSTIKFDFSTIYFKTELIQKIKWKQMISDSNVSLYNLLIQSANNLKYENKIYTFKENKTKENWDLKTVVSLVENHNRELATQILLLSKKTYKDYASSRYRFEMYKRPRLSGFRLFKKIRLWNKFNYKIKTLIK